MGRDGKVRLQYVGYLREALPLVASVSRYPKLVEYEYHVAKLVERERNKELLESREYDENIKFYHYTARDVHTPVWRAMQYLIGIGEAVKIGRCYYPASENGTMHFQLFCDGIQVSSPSVHVISRTAYVIAIEPNQNIKTMKSALQSSLGNENLFGIFVQDDLMLILLSPNAPADLIAELISWVKDAYNNQQKNKKILDIK